jgi:hypothetical protein
MAGQCVIASAEITSCKTTDEGETNEGKSGTQEIRFYLHLKKVLKPTGNRRKIRG